jgi:endoglucanase
LIYFLLAGDYVKFGFPFAFAMTVLAWGGVAYPEAYTATGQTNNLLDAVKWGTDYILKAHVAPNVLYGQVRSLNAITYSKLIWLPMLCMDKKVITS